jgi:hypothetical protein
MPSTRRKKYELTKELLAAGQARCWGNSMKKSRQDEGPPTTRNQKATQKKPPPPPSTPPPTPPIDLTGRKGRRILRTDKPRCTDFGINRRILYPGANFCSQCDFLQEMIMSCTADGNVDPDSRRFGCAVNKSSFPHTTFLFPSPYDISNPPPAIMCHSIIPPDATPDDCSSYACSSSEDESDDSSVDMPQPGTEDSDSDDSVAPISQAPPTLTPPHDEDMPSLLPRSPPPVHSRLSPSEKDEFTKIIAKQAQDIKRLQARLADSQKAERRGKRRMSRYQKKKTATNPEKISSVRAADMIRTFLDAESQKNNRTGSKVIESFFTDLLREDDISGELKQGLDHGVKQSARKLLRQNEFSKQACAKAIDMKNVGICLQTFDQLREMETGGKKSSRDSVLPSGSSVQDAQKVAQKFGEQTIKTTQGILDGGGEFFEFAPDELLAQVIDAFGLTEEAKVRPIRISLSIDGAQISKRIMHVTMGFKINDPSARCPFTRRPLFLSQDEQIMQSRQICWPTKIILKKETKDCYKHFAEQFKAFREFSEKWNVEKDGPRPESELTRRGFKPIRLALNMDLSATWKLFGVGGAAKVDKQPCHCCPIESKDLAIPNAVRCHKWCRDLHDEEGEDWECYHQEFLGEEQLVRMRTEMLEITQKLGTLADEIQQLADGSAFDHTEDPRTPKGNATSNLHSIHFDYGASETVTEDERTQFSSLLTSELSKRNLSTRGNLGIRRERLRDSLISEWKYRELKKGLDRGEVLQNSACAYLVIDAVPCILHMENRIGLKFLTLLLTEGLTNAVEKKLYQDLFPNSEKKRRVKLLEDAEQYINKIVLGTRRNPAQWECPTENQKKEIGTICMDNNRTRKVVTQLLGLIKICVPEGDERREWWEEAIINNYVPFFEMLRRKREFSIEDIAEFQQMVDKWFQTWVKLWGAEGCTNYIHLLSSGHISEYLRYWKSLYPHSQQGWEALNSLLKVFYFRRTARGGTMGGKWGTGKKSRILPIARWLLRRAMWASGYTYEEMEANVKANVAEGNNSGDEANNDDE